MTNQDYTEKFDPFISEGYGPTWKECQDKESEVFALEDLLEDLKAAKSNAERIDLITCCGGMEDMMIAPLEKLIAEAKYQLEQAKQEQTDMNDRLAYIDAMEVI